MRAADFGQELRGVIDPLGLACVSTGDDILVRGAAIRPEATVAQPLSRRRALAHMVTIGATGQAN